MVCRIFDPVSWLFIFLSLVSVSLATIFIARISSLYGVNTPDSVKLLLLPLQMLLGEQLETDNWFTKVAILKILKDGKNNGVFRKRFDRKSTVVRNTHRSKLLLNLLSPPLISSSQLKLIETGIFWKFYSSPLVILWNVHKFCLHE